jgi:hypothetical protein
MKFRVLIVLLVVILFSIRAYGQTDVGSASSAGAVTTDQPLATLTPTRQVELQERELSTQVEKLEAHALKTSSSRISLMDTDRQNIEKAYDTFRRAGHEMSPFDFLANTIALQAFPQGSLSDKNAQAVRGSLMENGIKNANIMLFSQAMEDGRQLTGKGSAEQYKQALAQAKVELHEALK